jgi:hypothetical protein
MPSHRRHRRLKWRSLYIWHRYAGLTAALFVCILAVTGILLNRTHALGFDQRFVRWTPLLAWYGIEGPTKVVGFKVGDQQVSLVGRRLYLADQVLPGEYGALQGAALRQESFVVAADGALFLFSLAGELIERLNGAPSPITRLGADDVGASVVEAHGSIFQSDNDLLEWRPSPKRAATIVWAVATPAALGATLSADYRGRGLSWERVLLDLHSGRLFGRYGTWVMDIAAGLMLMLAMTGIWLWTQRRR